MEDIQVEEFDFADNGGTVYEKNGVKVIHWQRSHAKDGASAYRLDWQISEDESLCFVWTGDGRPSELDIEYAAGCDVYVTESPKASSALLTEGQNLLSSTKGSG